MHIDRATIDAVLADWQSAPVDARLRGALRLVEALTKHPQDIDAAFVRELEAAGLDTEAIEDAANVAFHFNFINRLADAFEFPLLDEGQRRRLATGLDRAGRVFGRPRPSPSWARGDDGVLRPSEIELGRTHALRCAGQIDPALRRAVEAHAASWFGGRRGAQGTTLPEPLRAYVEKLARWAYEIIDEDIDALREAGWDDMAIFELTFVGAMGASLPALERLFEVLYGAAVAVADAA